VSRTFDDLQALHRVLEARRSGPAPLPITDTEKEARPMGSAYSERPPLDRTALRGGYTMCVGNATRLMSDARTLKDAGRYRSAYVILALALEELGAAMQLYEAGRSGVEDWEAWWRRYFTHPKKLVSTVLDLPGAEQADERFTLVREELVYVDFDRKHERFIGPRADDDTELLQLFDQEAVHAEGMVRALPSYAFERWEFEEMVQQSPEIAASVLYARIEELVSQEPAVSEKDLLTAIARDLRRSPDDFAVGFERWKKVVPKVRVYVDLLCREQERLRKERGAEGTG